MAPVCDYGRKVVSEETQWPHTGALQLSAQTGSPCLHCKPVTFFYFFLISLMGRPESGVSRIRRGIKSPFGEEGER